MEIKKKCIIARYDETITEPPFNTIEIDRVDVYKPMNDEGGAIFADRLRIACCNKNYHFRFYTISYVEGIDYEIIVY